jgi:hypothetical protein
VVTALPRHRDAGEIRELPDDGILFRDDESKRIDLLLKSSVFLAQVVEAVSELDDLFADGYVRSARRTRGA